MSPQLGITFYKQEPKPIFYIHRFRVIERERFTLLEPHEQKRNFNFQINGEGQQEKVVVRIYLDECWQVYKSRYYYMPHMDGELAKYLAYELLTRLKSRFNFNTSHILKEITRWK